MRRKSEQLSQRLPSEFVGDVGNPGVLGGAVAPLDEQPPESTFPQVFQIAGHLLVGLGINRIQLVAYGLKHNEKLATRGRRFDQLRRPPVIASTVTNCLVL